MPRPLHLSEPSEDDGELLYTVTVDRPTGPSLLGLIVRDDSVSVIYWPDGEEAVTMGTLYPPAEDVSDVDAAYARALEALPDKVQLVFVDYREELSDEQIQKQFNGEAPWDDSDLDEWHSENRYQGAIETIKEYVDADDIEILRSDTSTPIDKFDELRFEVEERDTSDPFADILRHTPHKLMRYAIGVESSVQWNSSEEEIEENVQAIYTALGLDPVLPAAEMAKAAEAIRGMLTEGYDGPVYVYWYGDVEPLIKAANNYTGDTEGTVKAQTITWDSPALLVLNGMQGSGMDTAFPWKVTLPFNRDNLKLDARGIGNGYSWEEVCGPVPSAYACEVTITETEG